MFWHVFPQLYIITTYSELLAIGIHKLKTLENEDLGKFIFLTDG